MVQTNSGRSMKDEFSSFRASPLRHLLFWDVWSIKYKSRFPSNYRLAFGNCLFPTLTSSSFIISPVCVVLELHFKLCAEVDSKMNLFFILSSSEEMNSWFSVLLDALKDRPFRFLSVEVISKLCFLLNVIHLFCLINGDFFFCLNVS